MSVKTDLAKIVYFEIKQALKELDEKYGVKFNLPEYIQVDDEIVFWKDVKNAFKNQDSDQDSERSQ